MKAYITSVGERTEGVCVDQLIKLGYNTCVLGKNQTWHSKYMDFIHLASKFDEPCVRIDADVIVNKEFSPEKVMLDLDDNLMYQYQVFDFYKNGLSTGQPMVYTPEAIIVIKRNLEKIDLRRPETSAWRLEEMNPRTKTIERIVGMHGFFQDRDTVNRAKENKIARKQIGEYDFSLVDKILNI